MTSAGCLNYPCRTPISWREAVTRVGREKFGTDWIGSLTEREKYLVDQYCGFPVPGRPSIPPKVRPLGATLEDEVGRAHDRRRWKATQGEYATKWLRACGFSYPRVNLADLNLNLQEEFVANQWSEDDILGSWSEDDSISGVDNSRLSSNPTRLEGAPPIPDAIIGETPPALAMGECEANAKDSAASLDCRIIEPSSTVKEPHRRYPLKAVRPKRDLSARMWEFAHELDRAGRLQRMRQNEIFELMDKRFGSSGEVVTLRTMRRILGLNVD
jgi:hypothetical protein